MVKLFSILTIIIFGYVVYQQILFEGNYTEDYNTKLEEISKSGNKSLQKLLGRYKRDHFSNQFSVLIEDPFDDSNEIIKKSDQKYRIVGGYKTGKGEIPYQVSLRTKKNQHFCGGSIIDDCHVLSARHCMFYPMPFPFNNMPFEPPDLEIWAGGTIIVDPTNPYTEDNAWHVWKVEYIFKHDWDDIAVIRINGNFSSANSSFIQPIALANKSSPGMTCYISGWGLLKESDSQLSTDLYAAKVTIIDSKKCMKMYAGEIRITPTNICAGVGNGDIDSCKGDSGGPLACNNTLVGVISMGKGCGKKHKPGIYTNVTSYRSWIDEKINSSKASQLKNVTIVIVLIIYYHVNIYVLYY